MNSKLKLPFLHVYNKFLQLISPLQGWRDGSRLLGAKFLGGLLVILVATLPFLENAQTGVIGAAVAIAWLMMWLSDRRDAEDQSVPIWTPIHLPLISYWAIALIATLLSPVRVAALDGMLKLTIYMIAFVSMSRMMRLGWRSVLVGTYLETALVVCAYAVQQWYLGAPELATWTDITSETAGTTRVYSFLGNPNLLAGYLIPALPLGAIAAIHWRSWGMKVLGAVVAILGAFCITQTQSRGGLLGLAAESFALVLLLVYWWGKRLPTWTLPVTFGGTAGAIALGTILVPTLRKRVVSIFGTEDSSNAFRVNVWMSVLNMIKVKPILGIGPGNKAFNLVYPLYQRSGYSALGAYSVPLELTVETGIIGVICYGWLIFSIFRQAWIALNRLRSDRNMDGLWIIAAIATIVGMMTHGLFDTVWYRPQVQLLWWLAIAIISSFYIAPIKHNES
ncbi:MAG: IctB family putative bicarbonate transporter [Pseudanabaena sp.]|jgi:putative inorganic carbon (HCO3(-)) transporter|nr:putative bicarbonate transporter, IctB family [Pseudanabaena sp. M090S1SP2A07QC]MCA6505591.1 putative bicarbonate transporter, IctB family [Pseudanabaena sp. M172S2SP2A07QC]MCA6520694.1 putative bicarbonate transporter, IctB family [Pseudanabaena sp. M051S1SP2A07QC]MCA6526527.1 putative bicarbonate transporter, IctB family [Pseudanabaena sp. M179S2SP2A07QC]MCA6531325.1 putative bicarbonate transporter, IctB family [Pseudanabaena sp. M125S2SP2A07QC]MCA6536731.1 putative bicarbonate transport